VGLGKAIEIAVRERDNRNKHMKELRDYFVARIIAEVPYVRYNGSKDKRMSNNANFSFEFIEGESLLLNMDLEGIAASSGSACSSGSLKGSHVLEAIGVDRSTAQGTIRFTLGKDNTKEQMDYTVEVIKKAVKKLRILSPLFNEIKGEPKYV
jgi:cysteine desulfurase